MYKSIYDTRVDNFLILLNEHFDGKKTEFAKALQLENPSFLSRITSPKQPKKISDMLARKMEQVTQNPAFWMDMPHLEQSHLSSFEERYALIPSFSIKACCGSGMLVDFEEVSDGFAFRTEWIQRKGYRADALEVIRAAGDSMLPIVRDGDILLIDRSQTRLSPTRPATYVIAYAHEISVKMLYYLPEEQRIILSSTNPDKNRFPDKTLAFDEQNQEDQTFRVIGRVVWHGGEM